MSNSRTRNSIINISVAMCCQVIGILISFIARSFFIKYLGELYLGLNGVFMNILSVLSLAELGFGSAIGFGLYKPLAVGDKETIAALMRTFKKIYRIIGIIVLTIGLALTPFLKFIINDDYTLLKNIELYFLLYVFNTGITYFYSYKRTLICADQKKYIDTLVRYSTILVLNILQVLVIVLTRNFLYFLLCQTVCTIVENFVISLIVNKKYSYLKMRTRELPPDLKKNLKTNVNALFFHKIGSVFVGAVDSILITYFVGLATNGRYSNYILISSGVNTIITQIFLALTSSVGNLGALESDEKKLKIYNLITYLNFAITNFAIISMLFLYRNFITVWIGESMLLSELEVLLIIVNFMWACIRRPTLTFKDGFGIYRQDMFKPIAEIVVNLMVSIVLGKFFGLWGILLGTIITYTTVSFWVEIKVLFKYGFHAKQRSIYFKLLKFLLVFAVSLGVTYLPMRFLPDNQIWSLFVRLAICVVVPNVVFFLLTFRMEERKDAFGIIKVIFGRILHRNKQPTEMVSIESVAENGNDLPKMNADNQLNEIDETQTADTENNNYEE